MSYIPDALRRKARERAQSHCEYCLYPEQYAMKTYEVDHVYAEKHGGKTTKENLCLSCMDCNRYKGSDLCSYDNVTDTVVKLYHPRTQAWTEHFQIKGGRIAALTPEDRVTVRLLRLNDSERIKERRRLIKINKYP